MLKDIDEAWSYFIKEINRNELIQKKQNKFKPEMYLRQLGFTYEKF